MSDTKVTPPGKVRGAYEAFLEAFQSAVEGANMTLTPSQRPLASSFASVGNGQATLSWSFYLNGWPSRRLARGRRLDVVVKALETFRMPEWHLIKSTVYVNYFIASEENVALVQSLHYDFMEGGQADHPYFHVQLSDEMISEADLRNVGFVAPVPQIKNECWVTTRIPTPDMTLASVVYCLVADHLGAKHFTEFADRVKDVQGKLPAPNFDAIKKSLASAPSHFKSSHWFSHMRN